MQNTVEKHPKPNLTPFRALAGIFVCLLATACGENVVGEPDDTGDSADLDGADTGTDADNDSGDTNAPDGDLTDVTPDGTGDVDDTGDVSDADTTDTTDTTDTSPPPPSVSSTSPEPFATNVALGGHIAVTFSEPMEPSTLNTSTFTVLDDETEVPGAVTYSGVTAIYTTTSPLEADTEYTAIVTTGAEDLEGNAIAAEYEWHFTTGTQADIDPPTVVSTSPIDSATGVAANRPVWATFSEVMDPSTITAASFTLTGPDLTPVSGSVAYAGARATFTPTAPLLPDAEYEANIAASASDLAGNRLEMAQGWRFTTNEVEARGPAPVYLGRAGDYVILSKSGIDTIPNSDITGNIGVSPIVAAALTGFSLMMDSSERFSTSDQVTGQVHAANYAVPTPSILTTAISNIETAYTDAASRTLPTATELGGGEIGGLTIAPGLYKWGTSVTISSNVTLSGGADDVWIFQIAGGITQASGTIVTLSGGASPDNIFWQSFGQVVLDTDAHMEGIVLSQTAIILRTGSSVVGRLLAQTAITLDQATVTAP